MTTPKGGLATLPPEATGAMNMYTLHGYGPDVNWDLGDCKSPTNAMATPKGDLATLTARSVRGDEHVTSYTAMGRMSTEIRALLRVGLGERALLKYVHGELGSPFNTPPLPRTGEGWGTGTPRTRRRSKRSAWRRGGGARRAERLVRRRRHLEHEDLILGTLVGPWNGVCFSIHPVRD